MADDETAEIWTVGDLRTVRTELTTRKGLFLLAAEAAESRLCTKQRAATGAAASWCLTLSPAMGPVPKVAVSAQAGKDAPSQARPGQHMAPGEEVSNVGNDFKNFMFRLARSLPEAGPHSGACACLLELSLHSQPGREGAAPSISLLAVFHLGTQSRDNWGSAGRVLF